MWSGYSEQGRGALERGPGGFSLNVPGAQEAAQAGQASAPVRGGQRGGGMAPTGNVVIPEAQDKTLQTLLRLGEGRLDKEVQRLQGEAYVQGAARAAEGVAMQEVLDEQPAWANVFGDSATVEGARAYSAQAAVEQWAVSVEADMPNLYKLASDEVPGVIMRGLSPMMTGDPSTDALIQQQAMKVLPGLVKQRTKGHIAYQQETALAERRKSFQAAGAFLESGYKAKPGTISPEDMNQRKANLFKTLTPHEGANLESWNKDVLDFVGSTAAAGSWRTIQALRDDGLLERLAPEEGARVESTIRQWADYHRANTDGDWYVRAGLIQAQMERNEITAVDGVAKLRALNGEFHEATGNPLALVPEPKIGASVETAAKAMYAERQAEDARRRREAATAADKAAVAAERNNMLVSAARMGMLHTVDATAEEKDNALSATFVQVASKDPNAAADLVARQWEFGKFAAPALQVMYQAGFRASLGSDTITPSFVKSYQDWRMLQFNQDGTPRRGGASAAGAYFGSDLDGMMSQFHQLTMQGTDIRQMGESAYATIRNPLKPYDDKDGTVKRAIETRVLGSLQSRFTSLPDGALRAATSIVGRHMKNYQHLPPQAAAEAALGAAVAGGMEIVGPATLQRLPGQRPMAEVLNLPATELGDLLEDEMQDRLAQQKLGTPDYVVWTRQPDVAGKPQVQAHVYVGGKSALIQFNGADLTRRYLKDNTVQLPAGPVVAPPEAILPDPYGPGGLYGPKR